MIAANREALRVLTHLRQYPDGSTVVVAVNATKIYEAEESDLLFGWFVAPCSLHDGLGSVNVSCIVAQPFENQILDQNLSCDLMLRLRQCLPQQQYQAPASSDPPRFASRSRNRSVYSDSRNSNQRRLSFQDLMPAIPAPAPMPAPAQARREYHNHHQHYQRTSDDRSFDNQRNHEANASFLGISRTISEESFTSSEASSSCVKIVPVQQQLQVSNLNQNERMMLDLLDKTISTQEILAAQQHEMASVIDYHGSQLQRISTAIERVENLLADSGERLKRMPQSKASVTSRRSIC